MSDDLKQAALAYHAEPVPGKISVELTTPAETQLDLALAYSPGVAEPCREIARDRIWPIAIPARAIWLPLSVMAPPCWAWATLAHWPVSR